MQVTGITDNGYEIRGYVNSDGSMDWKCDAIKKPDATYEWELQTFSSARELMVAIDKYDLLCRKNFTNKTAYLVKGPYGSGRGWIEEVTVTSIDANGKDVWIICNTRRRKVQIGELYADKDACDTYVNARKEATILFEKMTDALLSKLNEFRWAPKF